VNKIIETIMKTIKKCTSKFFLINVLCALFSFSQYSNAQCTSDGTDFWLSVHRGWTAGYGSVEGWYSSVLQIISTHATTVTFHYTLNNVSSSISLPANTVWETCLDSMENSWMSTLEDTIQGYVEPPRLTTLHITST